MNKKMKIGNVIAIAICIIITSITFTACNKDKVKKDVLNITAINGNSSKIVTKRLKSMEERSFQIDCYVFSTNTFDTRNNSYGYADCNDVYHFIDVETGVETKQLTLPTTLNFVVLDTTRNRLIGHYYVSEEEKDYVVTIDMDSGNIVLNKPFYVNGQWNASARFFRDIENEYVLLHPENGLVFINSYTGDIIRTLNIDNMCINNVVHDRKNNRIIGTTCINDVGESYIIAIDLNTGYTLSKVLIEDMEFDFTFFADKMDYDAETNSYILVSANNEVLFFDVATGKIIDRYQLDFDATSLKLWHSR